MEAEEERLFIRELAYRWSLLDLPSSRTTYGGYVSAITKLQMATNDAIRTEYIFNAVVDQAKALGKDSEWVDRELSFETTSQRVPTRLYLALLYLEQKKAVTDADLDLFNERRDRFKLSY